MSRVGAAEPESGEHARPSGGQSKATKGEQGCDENEAGDLEVCGVQVSGLGGLSIAGRVGIASTPVGVASTLLLVLHKTRPDRAKGLWRQVWLMAGGDVRRRSGQRLVLWQGASCFPD